MSLVRLLVLQRWATPACLGACVLAALTALVGGSGAAAEAPQGPAPDGASVPASWLPPGANASPLPSEQIFPPQSLPIRFDHRLHLRPPPPQSQRPTLTCTSCHRGARWSDSAADRLLPNPSQSCDRCHDVDHGSLDRAGVPVEGPGACDVCHLGLDAKGGGTLRRVVLPTANLRFSHRKHAVRRIGCAHCHGSVDRLGLARRAQLPRMAGCLVCHSKTGPARGEARGQCSTCHLQQPNGRLRTRFDSGELTPPRWLHGASHELGWLQRHKPVAAANSAMCSQCHSEQSCIDCHDGRLRPRRLHPSDWLSMHAQASRQDSPRSTSCHELQSFCGSCHRRLGIARDVGSTARQTGRRFHPPSRTWATGPRTAGHHAWEAMRNLNACVGCHSERDCATCHATKGLRGGAGVNPHPLGFASRCAPAFRRNARPCLVCHDSRDPLLSACQ